MVVTVVALVVPAHAQARDGTGLYSPFPSLTTKGYLRGYLSDFGVAIPSSRLQGGVVIGPTLRTPAVSHATPASARIHPEKDPSMRVVGVLTGVVAALLLLGLIYSRRRA